MNDTGTLAQNEYVQELFSILKDNGRDTSGLSALLGHVEGMESYIKRAEGKIGEMKTQLSELKEAQGHPVRTALQNAIKTLEHKVAEVKVQLAELKQNIVDGCRSAVQAFKEKSISALDKLATFFHIKSGLLAMDRSVNQAVSACDKSVENIRVFSHEYHNAGKHIKNMGRMLTGKPPIDAAKEAGKLARAASAPYKAQKAVLLNISGLANAMIQRLEQLEHAAEAKRDNSHGTVPRVREKEPQTLLGEVREAVLLVEQRKQLALPTPERAKVAGVEL